jgi:2,4-diaminopentanoate dehydrogenase
MLVFEIVTVSRKIRVIQWGTGSVGRTALRRIIDDGEFELAGVYVHSPEKNGLDAGDIVKRDPTGITATNDVDAIVALDADVVLHTSLISVPYEQQNDDVVRLLESGKSVISTNGFYRPVMHGEAYAAPLRAAALSGRSTLAGIGLNPGFIAERLAVMLSGVVARLDQIRCYETFDASLSPSTGLLFDAMGFGADPAHTDPRTSPVGRMYDTYYAETFDFVAEKLSTQVATITPKHEITLAPDDIVLRAGTIPRGTVAATTWRWFGEFTSGATMVHSILWTASHALHDIRDGGHWRVEIDGRPNVRATLDLSDPDPLAPPSRPTMDATAAVVVRAIPAVVEAPPGFYDLPVVAPFKTLGQHAAATSV